MERFGTFIFSKSFIDELLWEEGAALWAQLDASLRRSQPNVKREMPGPASNLKPCPASSKTSEAIFVAEIIGSKQVRRKKKTPVSMFLRLIYFKVNEITKEELAFSFAPFYLATHKQPAQIGSLFYWKKQGSPEKPVRPPGNVLGNTRNILFSSSVQTGQLHPESQKFMQVICLPGPWSPRICSATASDTGIW